MHHTGLYRISKLTRGTARAQLHFHWHRPRHTWRQAYVPQLPDGMVSSQTPEDISPTKPENRWTVKQKNSRNPFLLIAVFEIMDAAAWLWEPCSVGYLLRLLFRLFWFAQLRWQEDTTADCSTGSQSSPRWAQRRTESPSQYSSGRVIVRESTAEWQSFESVLRNKYHAVIMYCHPLVVGNVGLQK